MTPSEWCFDGTLAAALPFLSWRIVAGPDQPRAAVLFIALGLLSALAWARLDAPDVALVEAAVGAGLTGALLMSALEWADRPEPQTPALASRERGLLTFLLAGLAIGFGWVITRLPEHGGGLTAGVIAKMDQSGASHPVTAVLMNFRGYDTLLEVMVLLVVSIGARESI